MTDIRGMQLGQVVDFCIEYNEHEQKAKQEANAPKRRKATQGDIDSFFG